MSSEIPEIAQEAHPKRRPLGGIQWVWLVPIAAIGGLSFLLFVSGNRIKGAPKT